MKTLLVQDGSNGAVLRHCLVDCGCAVTLVRGLRDAQDVLARQPFSLLVLDLDDPEQRKAFCSWLDTDGKRENRFVLLGLETAGMGDSLGLFKAGVDDFLIKPYQAPIVRARLAAIERQMRQRAEWQRSIDGLNTVTQQQVAVAALGHCALAEDLPTVIDSAGWSIVYSLRVDLWRLLELAEDGQSLKTVAGFGWRAECLGAPIARPAEGSLTGRGLAGDDCMVFDVREGPDGQAADFVLQHGAVSGASVAVKGKANTVYGVLEAYRTERRGFIEDDLHFLQSVANVLGALIERKRAEAEVQKYQTQVQHLQRLESVGQLAAGLAHDYNNVLAVIHGHITLALGEPHLPPTVGTSLKRVLEAVERAANLTRQMLSFSRKQSLEPRAVDLNEVIASMANFLDRVLGRNVRLTVEPTAGVPAIHADAGMLDQVIMNLAVNARDAMANGGSLVIGTSLLQVSSADLRRHPEARAGEFVCLRVMDSGCGMDESTMRRIFDPFFTTKGPGKGTGLGLSTVYGIVKQHQGWIEVESKPGQGTTFRVFFPSLGRPVEASVAREKGPFRARGQETVMLVDDEPTLRELGRLLLGDLGYQVLHAASGEEATEVWSVHKQQIDVLLTDLVLPDGLTGLELADRFKQERPALKVVITSGYSAEEVKKKSPAHQGFHFIQKPYHAESLGRALRACLDQAQPV
jgi:signal transduction histidine kinase/DNA-binding response OmpR family regulator